MTHPDPPRPDRKEPRRTPRFNALVILLVVGLFIVAGAYVWLHWSASEDDAAEIFADNPVREAQLPPPGDHTLSPEGREAAGRAPADR